jgi:hypothetical protein
MDAQVKKNLLPLLRIISQSSTPHPIAMPTELSCLKICVSKVMSCHRNKHDKGENLRRWDDPVGSSFLIKITKVDKHIATDVLLLK